MRIIIAVFFILTATQINAFSETFYCLIQNFAGADENKVHNYSNFNRFTMNIERENNNSDFGRLKFSNTHPMNFNVDFYGYNSGLIVSEGSMSLVFYLQTGQLFQSFTTLKHAAALSAKCKKS
jgi:hypothetical protein